MQRRLATRDRLALCALAVVAAAGGCCCCGGNALVLSGNWSLGLRRAPAPAPACDCGQGIDSDSGGPAPVSSSASVAAPNPTPAEPVEQNAAARSHRPLLNFGNPGPPPAVHSRFHPVPTRPVFGGAAPAKPRPTMEFLPHEYDSTPRLKSVPRPKLDPEELQEQKQKAIDADRDENAPLPRDFSP